MTTLVHINQYKAEKQSLLKKIDVDNNIPDVSGLVRTTVLNTKIGEVEKKIPDMSGLMITTVLKTKISEVVNKILDISGLIKKTDYDAKVLDIEKIFYYF